MENEKIDRDKDRTLKKSSVAGSLSAYRNKRLLDQEKGAWKREVVKKYHSKDEKNKVLGF